jgi:biopolymer transport protein TolQ
MIIHHFLLTGNPFIDAYTQSDWVGKGIFLALIALSVITWSILLFKWRFTRRCEEQSHQFRRQFSKHRLSPLQVEIANQKNPFIALYRVLKRQTIEILNKNRQSAVVQASGISMLSNTDISLVELELDAERKREKIALESYLYILSTIVTLGPFLGLLGTVWGILTTFSHLQLHATASNQAVLGGLSLALATTVLGLIDAIPALIGYNYLKQRVKDFDQQMELFSREILTAVELQYRQVDL